MIKTFSEPHNCESFFVMTGRAHIELHDAEITALIIPVKANVFPESIKRIYKLIDINRKLIKAYGQHLRGDFAVILIVHLLPLLNM